MWKILIVDDEPPIRSELNYLLSQDSRCGEIREAGNVLEAINAVVDFKPDVIFLDISMPGTSGMKLAESLTNYKNPPAIVFVTAYAEFAAKAFNLDAVDYVLKPVELDRLGHALQKIEAFLSARPDAEQQNQVRLPIEHDGVKTFIPASDILYIEAHGDYANIVTHESSALLASSMDDLERLLEPEGFLRTHRSYLVNLDAVHTIESSGSGLFQLTLDGVDEKIPVARRRASLVKDKLGL